MIVVPGSDFPTDRRRRMDLRANARGTMGHQMGLCGLRKSFNCHPS